jgi:hypothetical protein
MKAFMLMDIEAITFASNVFPIEHLRDDRERLRKTNKAQTKRGSDEGRGGVEPVTTIILYR